MNEPAESERSERHADYKDLAFIKGDEEMLRWRSARGERWAGKEFALPHNESGNSWELPDDFPETLRQIVAHAQRYERQTRSVPLSKIGALLDVRFLHREYKSERDQHTDVHFDAAKGDVSNSLHVFLWSSEKSTTTTLYRGTLTQNDFADFTDGMALAQEVMSERAHLSPLSPLPGHLIVIDKFVPHSTPTLQLRDGQSPRVFVRLHTWIEQ